MKVVVNGESREVSAGVTLQLLLDAFELTGERIAVERNGEIVKKSDYISTMLKEGDELEVVRFVGGG